MRDAYLFYMIANSNKFQIRLIKMKKALAVAGILALSITPTASFADHLTPQETEIRPGGNLAHTNLSDADLTNANLKNANLKDARLRNADLSGADLTNANLRDTDMKFANLKNADLKDAQLNNADLRNIDAIGATLEFAHLNNAKLGGAKLNKAKLGGANLNRAFLNAVTDLSGATLTSVNATNLYGCTEKLPKGWVCTGSPSNQRLTYNDQQIFFTFKPKNEKKVKVFISSLPYQTECGRTFLKTSLSNNGKYLVQLDKATKYAGFDFKKAGQKFIQTYKLCDMPTIQPVNPNPAPSINF